MSAVSLIQSVISKHGPLTIRELYQVASKVSASALTSNSSEAIPEPSTAEQLPEPPQSERLIPSMSYLRKHVLPQVKRYGTYEQIHILKEPTSDPGPSSSTTSKKSSASSSKSKSATGSNMISSWVWRETPSELIARARAKADAEEKKKAPKKRVVYYPPRSDSADDYGTVQTTRAASLDHLNVRRARARPLKIAKERELGKKRWATFTERFREESEARTFSEQTS